MTSSDTDRLMERLQTTLDARECLAEPLPRTLTSAYLRLRVEELVGDVPDLGYYDRFSAKPTEVANTEIRDAIHRANEWLTVGDAEGAYDYLQRAIDDAISAGSAYYCAAALSGLVSAAHRLNRSPESCAAAIEALKFIETYNIDLDGAVEHICSNLAQTFVQLAEPALAGELSALSLLTAISNKHVEFLTVGLAGLSEAYRMSHRAEEALQFALLATECSALGPQYMRAYVRVSYASALYRIGRVEEALAQCEQVLSEAAKLYDYQSLGRCLQLKAILLRERGQFSGALDSYHRAVDLARQVSLSDQVIPAFIGLGILYMDLNDPESALLYLRQAVALKSRLGSLTFDTVDMLLIAACYRKLGKTGQAEKTLEMLMEFSSAVGNPGLMALCAAELALIDFQRDNYDGASRYWSAAIDAAQQLAADSQRVAAQWWMRLAAVHRLQSDPEKALNALTRVDALWSAGPDVLFVPQYHLIRAWLREAEGPEAVRDTLYSGLQVTDRLRHALPLAAFRQAEGLAGAESLFNALIQHEIDHLPVIELYLLCERARGRRLIDELSKAELPAPAGVPPESLQREAALLGSLRGHMADLASPEDHYKEAINQVEYDSLLAELGKLWDSIEPIASDYVFLRRGGLPDYQTLIDSLELHEH